MYSNIKTFSFAFDLPKLKVVVISDVLICRYALYFDNKAKLDKRV